MSAPHRVQRKRAKGWRLPPNTVCVTRPGRWGNPLVTLAKFPRSGLSLTDRVAAVQAYRDWIEGRAWTSTWRAVIGKPPTAESIRLELRGKNLACFCPLDLPCHADVLLEIANGPVSR